MTTYSTAVKRFILACSISVACVSVDAKELSLIRGDFSGTTIDADAEGTARSSFTANNPKFRLDLRGLTPNTEYQFTVDGILEETFMADSKGRVHQDFRLNPSASKLALDFDPRGSVLGISDGTDEVLSMIFSGEGEPEDIRVDERTSLLRAETELRGRVELRYLEQKNKDRFIVHFSSMERGDYEFYVDGQLEAEIALNKGRSTMRSFELGKNAQANKGNGNGNGNSKKLVLDFDPRGKIVDVVRDGAIIFSGEMLAQIEGINAPQLGETTAVLTATAIDPDATGSASVTLAADGDLSLVIEVSDLAAGSYDVVIGGTVSGTIVVTGIEPDTTGELIFSSDPESGELLLDFDPLGQTVEIRQGTDVVLSGILSTTLTELPAPTVVETELPLLNQAVIAEGSSHITLTEDGTTLVALEVDLETVPAGAYDLKVGGASKGTITVTDVDGELSGELVFNNDGSGLPLDFDPRGQSVTIEQAGVVLFQRLL